MTMRTALGLLTVACSVAVLHCSAGLPYVCHGAVECGLEPDGGTDAGAPDVVAPPGCNLTESPKESAACVDDAVGVFVSPSGDDGATGKKLAPVKSISKGIELAASRGLPRVYVCEGTYETSVEIKAPVSIHGGFSCQWAYTGAKPKLAPPKGIALRVTGAGAGVVVEDLEVVGSADANTPGDSAIAVFVTESPNVTFRRTNLSGGAGIAGGKGAARSNYAGASAAKGGDANVAVAGAGPTCSCTNSTTSKGGNGAAGNGAGFSDGSATPPVGTTNVGASGTIACGDGQSGANAIATTLAGKPSPAAGTILSSGWESTKIGTTGGDGNPGQGGGGGGAKTTLNMGNGSAGGGGGCGGCGGGGGGAGSNGGSSFALVVFNSSVNVDSGTLVTAGAGRGGAGGDGQEGQGGGAVGGGACNGGPGGSGAGGSGGGGGAGGQSVPVAFVGREPTVTNATVTPGTKGAGGPGGTPGGGAGNPGAPGMPGPEGKAQNTLAL